MAKRPTKSQADDSGTAAPAQPRARRSRAPAPTSESAEVAQALGATETQPAPAESNTQPARGRANSQRQSETDRGSRDALTSESVSMGSEPSEEDIRMRAYHLYLERGGAPGSDFDDWLEAERELREQR
jgi:Protein of unknown function (DUF2934)